MATRVLLYCLLIVFTVIGCLDCAAQAKDSAFALKDPRKYYYHQTQLETTQSQKREFGAEITISPKKDGSFVIGGGLAWTPGPTPEFGGSGILKKDGLIHFSWEDSQGKKGEGTIRFLDDGKKVALKMRDIDPEWILAWVKKPVDQKALSKPGS